MSRRHWEPIWEFATANFLVVYSATEYDLDLSWDDDGEVARGLESGRYVAFVARVQVFLRLTGQEVSVNYLAGCIYESAAEFINHRGIGYRSPCGAYFSDMVREATGAARKAVKKCQGIRVRAEAT